MLTAIWCLGIFAALQSVALAIVIGGALEKVEAIAESLESCWQKYEIVDGRADRLERLSTELGERIDLVATACDRDRHELVDVVAEGLRFAADHIAPRPPADEPEGCRCDAREGCRCDSVMNG